MAQAMGKYAAKKMLNSQMKKYKHKDPVGSYVCSPSSHVWPLPPSLPKTSNSSKLQAHSLTPSPTHRTLTTKTAAILVQAA